MEEMILDPLLPIISMNYTTTAITRTCIESVISLRTTELTFKIKDIYPLFCQMYKLYICKKYYQNYTVTLAKSLYFLQKLMNRR
jgi:hypothetical protein